MIRRMVRNFRRLPPHLRVVSILGLLLSLVSLALLGSALIAKALSFPLALWDSDHIYLIGVNLSMLSLACTLVGNTYSVRFRHPDSGPFPLSSWQCQARTLALLAALPLCALALTTVSPSDSLASFFAGVFSMFGAVIMLMASIWAFAQEPSGRPAPAPPMH
jgi:hypothetical protein